MKILIVRLGALGDIVHAVPAAAALRRGLPSARIDWLVDERHREVVDLVRGIDGRIPVNPSVRWRELPGVVRQLRADRYDVALDFQGLLKSAVLARLSGARRVIGFSRQALRERTAAVFYHEHQRIPRGEHVIAKNLHLAGALGVDVSQILFPFHVPSGPIIEGPYALLNPGAAWPNKRWPPRRFGEIAAWLRDRHGTPSLVLWGPRELQLAQQVSDASAGAANPAPPTRIGDVLALARGARLIVSGDTGPLHLAAAVGTPIVGLYGPTSPERNGPWRAEDVTISRNATCVCHHQRRCRRETTAPCIDEITVADVQAAIEQRLRA
jgi:heptosyltransferase I